MSNQNSISSRSLIGIISATLVGSFASAGLGLLINFMSEELKDQAKGSLPLIFGD